MHSFEQCKVKIEGIKALLNRVKDHSEKTNSDAIFMTESAIVMCDELLREDIDGKEKINS